MIMREKIFCFPWIFSGVSDWMLERDREECLTFLMKESFCTCRAKRKTTEFLLFPPLRGRICRRQAHRLPYTKLTLFFHLQSEAAQATRSIDTRRKALSIKLFRRISLITSLHCPCCYEATLLTQISSSMSLAAKKPLSLSLLLPSMSVL